MYPLDRRTDFLSLTSGSLVVQCGRHRKSTAAYLSPIWLRPPGLQAASTVTSKSPITLLMFVTPADIVYKYDAHILNWVNLTNTHANPSYLRATLKARISSNDTRGRHRCPKAEWENEAEHPICTERWAPVTSWYYAESRL